MRLRTLANVALFALLAACSSKGGETATDEDNSTKAPDRMADNAAAPTTDTAPTDPGAPPPSLGAGGGSSSGGSSSGGTDPDAGTTPAPNPNTPKSSLCVNGSVAEVEGNDTAAAANAIPAATGSFCGVLSSAADVDFVSFTLPANAKYLSFGSSFTAQGLSITFTANGKSFKVGETPVWAPGQQYVAQISGAAADYRLEIEIKQ